MTPKDDLDTEGQLMKKGLQDLPKQNILKPYEEFKKHILLGKRYRPEETGYEEFEYLYPSGRRGEILS